MKYDLWLIIIVLNCHPVSGIQIQNIPHPAYEQEQMPVPQRKFHLVSHH